MFWEAFSVSLRFLELVRIGGKCVIGASVLSFLCA